MSVKPGDHPPLSQDEFRYDAFISYSGKDKTWVQDVLLLYLQQAKIRPCVDYSDFEIGAPAIDNMERAIEQSRRILLVLTPNWVSGQWTTFELLLAQMKDPASRLRRVLPLLVKPCELPDRLKVFTYLDLTEPREFDRQMQRLIHALQMEPLQPVALQPTLSREYPVSARTASIGFDHERGLGALDKLISPADLDTKSIFAVLESRLLENLQDERRYGTSESIRAERARVIYELNRIALRCGDKSFNDLCRG